jgi:Uma2 family endonuclease
MSTIPVSEVLTSPEEYIEGELHSEVRHEYYSGRVVAMAGASDTHGDIVSNLHIELGGHLRSTPCRTFVAEMKVRLRVGDEDWFYYPDILVNCDASGQQKYFCETPAVIVEVFSESTEDKDRREKFFAYTRFASLHTYIIAAQASREVTVYRRGNGEWKRTILTGSDTLSIPELEFSVSLDAIYARTGL